MNKTNNFIHHSPEHYIAGMINPETLEWYGEIYARQEDMFAYVEQYDISVEEFNLVMMMARSQEIYEDWWYYANNEG